MTFTRASCLLSLLMRLLTKVVTHKKERNPMVQPKIRSIWQTIGQSILYGSLTLWILALFLILISLSLKTDFWLNLKVSPSLLDSLNRLIIVQSIFKALTHPIGLGLFIILPALLIIGYEIRELVSSLITVAANNRRIEKDSESDTS